MNQLQRTWIAQNKLSTSFDPNMENYEYIDQVLQYIQLGRLDCDQLINVIPFFVQYAQVPGQVPNCENMFIGLCAIFEVRPTQFLAYLTGRTNQDVYNARRYAVEYMSKVE
eukprot:NODE_29_length_37665_cov_1.081563.p33 type:complete len:111 gc:universal NODE_29_length_37665_cov_1.081563:2705-3037(+)